MPRSVLRGKSIGLERIPIESISVTLVLASASPRRQELLRNAGISFTVQPASIDETPFAGETPRECAERLAREKALAVFDSNPQQCVLGADTIVVVDDVILGKPRDGEDAGRMLRLLSGRTHVVITGVCLVGKKMAGGDLPVIIASETTQVTMSEISDEEIRNYIATGEPMDKAGAYAIQGVASRWIPRIEGDYSNVVGLPVALVYALLRAWEML
jgi:septum formation protein